MGMYDKLGDLLNEALESGEIYTKEQLDVAPEVKAAFESFGISMNFTWDEAKKIYHEKLKFYHPDKKASNANSSREITEKLIADWKIISSYYETKK